MQANRHVLGVRVAERVLERLLRDPQDLGVALRVATDAVVQVERDVALLQALHDIDVLA